MPNAPKKNPLESAAEMELKAHQLEVRARKLRDSAFQLRETARKAASEKTRIANVRDQQRKAKQVAAIQQLSQQNTAPEPVPSTPAQFVLFLRGNPLLRGAAVLLMRLVMLAILVGGFLFAYQKISENRTQGRQDGTSESVLASFDSLEDLLKRATPEQLQHASQQRVDDASKGDFKGEIERLENARARISIAERMLKLGLGDEQQAFAEHSLAFSRFELEVLRETFDVSSRETRTEMSQFFRKLEKSEDKRIQDIRTMAKSFMVAIDYATLERNVSESDTELAWNLYDEAIDAAGGNSKDAVLVYSTGVLAHNRYQSKGTLELLHKFRTKYAEHANLDIRKLAATANLIINRSGGDLAVLSGSPKERTDRLLKDLNVQVDKILASPLVASKDCQELLDKLNMAMKTGRIKETSQMLVRIELAFSESDEIPREVTSSLEKMKMVLGTYQQPFPLTAIRNKKDDPMEFAKDGQQDTILVFANPDAVSDAEKILDRLAQLTVVQRESDQLRILMVYLAPFGDDQWLDLRIAELPLNCEWCRIHSTFDTGQEFLKQVPMQSFPFWILLDSSQVVVALNPPDEQLETELFELTRKKLSEGSR